MAISLDTPRPITKLDAVNIVLRARGEGPTSSLTNPRGSAREAIDTLAEANLTVQSDEWSFNKEDRLELTPDSQGNIVLPHNLMKFKPVGVSSVRSLTQRGNRLYDRAESSFKFKTPVFIEATLALPFEELPQPARWYVTVLAAWNYGNQNTPGDASMRPTEIQMASAKSALETFDSGLRNNTNLRTNPHFRRLRKNR